MDRDAAGSNDSLREAPQLVANADSGIFASLGNGEQAARHRLATSLVGQRESEPCDIISVQKLPILQDAGSTRLRPSMPPKSSPVPKSAEIKHSGSHITLSRSYRTLLD